MITTALLFLYYNNRLIHQQKIINMKKLAGSIAHEIRTPLTSIMMKGRVLRNAIEMEEVEKGKIFSADSPLKVLPSEIINVVNSAQTIIDMTLTKFRAYPLYQDDILNIHDMIQEALDHYPFEGDEKERIYWQKSSPFLFKGDADFFIHVLFNLIKNSLYYTQISKGKIFIWTDNKGKLGKLYFKDTGPGIPKNLQKNIFRELQGRRREGTGLGLAFCKNTIESLGGSIVCESTLGLDTTFIISLPINEVQ